MTGWAAEDQVLRGYLDHGYREVARRWRGAAGEIDLIMVKDHEVIFVEVKAARSHGRAAESLSQRQIGRLCRAATECLALFPKGSATPMRFDLALVDGQGVVRVMPGVIGA